jgi:hypothetical protein
MLLDVIDETCLTFSNSGQAQQKAPWFCMKADDTVHLLHIGADGGPMVFVLDMHQNLVTRIMLSGGACPAKADYAFGAIIMTESAYRKRHGLPMTLRKQCAVLRERKSLSS